MNGSKLVALLISFAKNKNSLNPADPSKLRDRTPDSVSIEVGAFKHTDPPIQAVIIKIDVTQNLGALTHESGLSIAKAAELALEKQLPLVGYITSVGADVNEGISAAYGWGLAAKKLVDCSGIIPIIFATFGPTVSGPALLLGISDISIMSEDSYAFVSGPTMVKQFTGVDVDTNRLGGPDIHTSKSGVANFVVKDETEAEHLIAELLTLLPPNADTLPPTLSVDDPADRKTPDIENLLPENIQGAYDIRDIIKQVVDDGELLESKPNWAKNIITAFATLNGNPVGIIANQPQVLAGTLDIAASQKSAHFVNFLDSFNIPILTFVDTPGFQPGRDQEWRGMIRQGAQLAFAYARASVPRICITLRKSYGGAYIVLDSKNMGNDFSFAWPSAEIAVMGAKGAVEILHRSANAKDRQVLEEKYHEQHLNPYKAAERGSIDAVIAPENTRNEIANALDILNSKRETIPPRSHDNTPL